jgi:hypothetical protein
MKASKPAPAPLMTGSKRVAGHGGRLWSLDGQELGVAAAQPGSWNGGALGATPPRR